MKNDHIRDLLRRQQADIEQMRAYPADLVPRRFEPWEEPDIEPSGYISPEWAPKSDISHGVGVRGSGDISPRHAFYTDLFDPYYISPYQKPNSASLLSRKETLHDISPGGSLICVFQWVWAILQKGRKNWRGYALNGPYQWPWT